MNNYLDTSNAFQCVPIPPGGKPQVILQNTDGADQPCLLVSAHNMNHTKVPCSHFGGIYQRRNFIFVDDAYETVFWYRTEIEAKIAYDNYLKNKFNNLTAQMSSLVPGALGLAIGDDEPGDFLDEATFSRLSDLSRNPELKQKHQQIDATNCTSEDLEFLLQKVGGFKSTKLDHTIGTKLKEGPNKDGLYEYYVKIVGVDENPRVPNDYNNVIGVDKNKVTVGPVYANI